MFNKKSRSQGRPQGDKHLTTSNRVYPPGGHVSDPYSLYGCPVDKIFPIQQSENIEWGGITPAYAGNAFESDHIVLNFWDHPRIRGEYNPPLRPYMSRMG